MTPCIVVFAICSVSCYTALNIYMTLKGYTLSDTLTEQVFKFYGLEMLGLSGIKISKHIGSAFGKADDAVDGLITDLEDENNDSQAQ